MSSWRNKDDITKWTIGDVQSFVFEINITKSDAIISEIQKQNIDGESLDLMDTWEDLLGSIDNKTLKISCKQIYNRVQEYKNDKNAFKVKYKEQNDEDIIKNLMKRLKMDPKKEEKKEFYVNLRAAQGKFVKLLKLCTKQTTLREVRQYYVDQEGGKVENISLKCGKKVNSLDDTLEKIGIIDGHNLITISFKVKGGANMNVKKKLKKKRSLNNHVNNKLVNKDSFCMDPDSMTFDNSKELRYRMKCGHVVGCDSLFTIIKVSFESKSYDLKDIKCPLCEKIWEWKLCTIIADLDENEYVKYTSIYERRNLIEVKLCPTCGVQTERPKDLTHFNVFHDGCPQYCYTCGRLWKTGGLQICGNDNCPNAHVQKALAECKWVKCQVVTIPVFRACPKCLTFIDKDEGCKDVTCTGCGIHFCFGCLKIGNHACGGGWGACVDGIHPAQKLN